MTLHNLRHPTLTGSQACQLFRLADRPFHFQLEQPVQLHSCSIGNSREIGSTNPRTIKFIASSWLIPRLLK